MSGQQELASRSVRSYNVGGLLDDGSVAMRLDR